MWHKGEARHHEMFKTVGAETGMLDSKVQQQGHLEKKNEKSNTRYPTVKAITNCSVTT